MSHASTFLDEVVETVRRIEPATIEALCDELVNLRDRDGRLFILGVGGSAGNAGHAVNDFRKLCGIEAYAPTDNVSELTARTNDEGWPTVFSEWLKVSRANAKDAILIFSVGGGNLEKNVSPNIVSAIALAKERGLRVLGVVGRDGGYTKKAGDCVVVDPDRGRQPRYAACGGVPGRGLALPGVAPEAAEERHQMVKAVFLDRDGVINANLVRDGKPVAPTTLDEFRIFPDAAAAAQRLKDAGFLLIVVTNQPDVRTGLTPKATMEAMHDRIRALMPIDDFEICLHTDADNCACRKPKPGLLLQAAAKHGIDLSGSIMVGDRWRDVLAGQAAGCAARSGSITALSRSNCRRRIAW